MNKLPIILALGGIACSAFVLSLALPSFMAPASFTKQSEAVQAVDQALASAGPSGRADVVVSVEVLKRVLSRVTQDRNRKTELERCLFVSSGIVLGLSLGLLYTARRRT